ncbi:3-dehydroquinate synthetase [Serpentinimonas maccroryi]|uniref:3-dehydroquinate synthetase n=1 Tax=Serpentinimonas maccroryi TaxID=1458426 RepID=A0A060NQ45_9BURK|nr:3-dehydroquinate synthase family protein [Serpentinimonas maccroryi]BAO83480.1 3-dehydroquinate synthetase [Serpentinimonas maccroryi]
MFESSEFAVKTSCGAYRVLIGADVVAGQLHESSVAWLVDANVARLHSNLLPASYIGLRAIESEKNFESIARIVEQLRDLGSTRDTRLIAVGGGIVQDLATFAASCYMRGIPWTYLPTTLLSMVDSCIGGKSSINVGRYKNIAGNFYPPKEVLIDTGFCSTLTSEQIAEGLCEAAKICYAASDNAFTAYLAYVNASDLPPAGAQLAGIIRHSLETKKRFIEEDEFDQGVRLLLNFGHTFGHAIEGASSYAISHGIAVGLGMLAAAHCSVRLGYASAELSNVASLSRHIRFLLRAIPSVAANLRVIRPEEAMAFFQSDKKHSAHSFILILFDAQGRLQQVKVPRSAAIRAVLLSTFHHLCEHYDEIQ